MDQLRSALFLDFDNIFAGLMDLDRQSGLTFAQQPGQWLDSLSLHGLGNNRQRRFLQCRAYLNPAGTVRDKELGNDSGYLYLQKFRPNLTRAGFEVIDCPSLTTRQKNAADIRIVIDVLASLESGHPLDEVVIASSDADFTPLLQVLRARDLRVLIMTAGDASPAYRSVADDVIGPEELIEIVSGTLAGAASEATGNEPDQGDTAQRLIVREIANATGALNLSSLGNRIRGSVGGDVEQTSWFGHGSLSAFIRSWAEPPVIVEAGFVWDEERHDRPDIVAVPTPAPAAKGGPASTPPAGTDLPAAIADIRSVTDLPRLPTATWPAAFATLAKYLATEPFNLTACTAWIRDELKDTATPVGRTPASYIVQGVMRAGVNLSATPPPDGPTIARAFRNSIVDTFEASGNRLGPDERAVLDSWLGGEGEGNGTGTPDAEPAPDSGPTPPAVTEQAPAPDPAAGPDEVAATPGKVTTASVPEPVAPEPVAPDPVAPIAAEHAPPSSGTNPFPPPIRYTAPMPTPEPASAATDADNDQPSVDAPGPVGEPGPHEAAEPGPTPIALGPVPSSVDRSTDHAVDHAVDFALDRSTDHAVAHPDPTAGIGPDPVIPVEPTVDPGPGVRTEPVAPADNGDPGPDANAVIDLTTNADGLATRSLGPEPEPDAASDPEAEPAPEPDRTWPVPPVDGPTP